MLRVKWFAVNYSSDGSTLCMVDSLMKTTIPNQIYLSLEILDNSSSPSSALEALSQASDRFEIRYLHTGSNLGYFGAARWRYNGLKENGDLSWDWVIISNVDIELDGDGLWEQLIANFAQEKIGVFAPGIISTSSGVGQNPLMASRPSRLRFELLRLITASVLSFNVYLSLRKLKLMLRRVASKRRRVDARKANRAILIYAPHGSIMAFHDNFLSRVENPFEHCSFLFSEEITVAERVRENGLLVWFVPEAVVFHNEHVSTGEILRRDKVRQHFQAIDCVIKKYFRGRQER